MAFVRNMIKTTRVEEALKQMESGFLSKPEIRTLCCWKTKLVCENYKGNKHTHSNSSLRLQYQLITSPSCPFSNTRVAQFHQLAENALLAWTANLSSKNPDVIVRFSGLESPSGIRNYAKDADSKKSSPAEEKKDLNPVEDDDSAARFAEAKRILKEKRMAKGLDYPKRSPFEEP